MVLVLTQRPQTQSLSRTAVHSVPDVRELVAFCPGCKTLETLWFSNGWLCKLASSSNRGNRCFMTAVHRSPAVCIGHIEGLGII